MLVLDTHILLWMVEADDRLRPAARAAIEAERNNLCFSAMAIWETAMLIDKGKMMLSMSIEQLLGSIGAMGVREVAITGRIGMDAGMLPGSPHGDPADRLMIATARALDGRLLTADRKILAYAAHGHVRAIDATL